MVGTGLDKADDDIEARLALWKAISVAANDVRHRFAVKEIHGIAQDPIRSTSEVPDVATWRLVEALSLLCVILRSNEAKANLISVFGKTGPVEIQEDGVVRHLWAQQTVWGDLSALSGRPDLVVTSTSDLPHPGNAVRIIEAKCVRQLGAQTIRSEFGKAHDLRVATYFIWSFYSPSAKIVAGARGLGIDLEPLGFDTGLRGDLLTSPEALISHVAHAQEQSSRAQRFARALESAGQEARRKLLGPAR